MNNHPMRISLLVLGLLIVGCKPRGTASRSATSAQSDAARVAAPIGAPGGGGTIGGCRVFPPDNAWNRDVSAAPVHPRSDVYVASIGKDDHLHPDFGTVWDGAPNGIPFVTVKAGQAPVAIEFTDYGDESDPGPYPIPPDAPIEGGPGGDGDRHVLVVEEGTCRLFELYNAHPVDGGKRWQASSGAIWDLNVNDAHPVSWTSADAAGLPIFPGLVRFAEVNEQGEIRHALRFTAERTQRGYVAPASHHASKDGNPDLPPMGLRLRMKASYDCAALSKEAQVICRALKRYGMLLADNGSSWFISGAPDPRWNDDALRDLKRIPGSAFEAVDTGPIETY
jgi:hypothetical protein